MKGIKREAERERERVRERELGETEGKGKKIEDIYSERERQKKEK